MLGKNKSINAISMFLVALILNGCTSKTVYLFNTGYPHESVNKVAEQLILLGYDVENIDAEIPAAFTDTAIATHPVFASPDDLVSIEHILNDQNFPAPHFYRFAQGNHFYGVKSIGLYLRNGYQKVMPPIMGDISCYFNGDSVDATLEFRRSGEVILELGFYRNGELLNNQYQQHTGKYSLLNSSIQLDFSNFKTDYLPVKEVQIETYSGEKKADHLVIHSKNNNSPIENCLFEAIYY